MVTSLHIFFGFFIKYFFFTFFITDGEESTGAKDRPKIVDPAMFKPFVQLLQHKGNPKNRMYD